jgi:uncharacterized membrane protein
LTAEAASSGHLEHLLGRLLHYGTLTASGLIAVGLVPSVAGSLVAASPVALGPAGMCAATAGIALFILLPVMRVALMLILFLQARDYRYSATAALVLLIISISFFVGTR